MGKTIGTADEAVTATATGELARSEQICPNMYAMKGKRPIVERSVALMTTWGAPGRRWMSAKVAP